MKLNHTGNNTPELDLTDENTITQLLNADCLKPAPDKEMEATEKAIENLKPVKIQITLSPSEHAIITRQADVLGLSPKEFLHKQMKELLIDKSVGKTLISSPSNLSGCSVAGKKITAPTGLARRSS